MPNYVYIMSEPQLWTTGFYKPRGTFEPDKDFPSAEEAAKRVHWLNGGKSAELTDHTLETYMEVILAALSKLLKRSFNPRTEVRRAGDTGPGGDYLANRIDEIIRIREEVRNQKREAI